MGIRLETEFRVGQRHGFPAQRPVSDVMQPILTTADFEDHIGLSLTINHQVIDGWDAGLYLKRARALEATWGNQAFHRDRYAKLLGF